MALQVGGRLGVGPAERDLDFGEGVEDPREVGRQSIFVAHGRKAAASRPACLERQGRWRVGKVVQRPIGPGGEGLAPTLWAPRPNKP